MKQRKIKICHVTTRFLTGGAAKNIFYTLSGLAKETYEIDLIVGRDANLQPIKQLGNINTIQIRSLTNEINPLSDLKSIIKLYTLFKSRTYHIVHTHQTKAGVLGRIAAKMAQVPIIIHGLHGISFHDSLNPLMRNVLFFLEKITAMFTNCIVPVGEDLKNKYIRRGIGQEDKYYVIHSGMNLKAFFKAGDLSPAEIKSKKREIGVTDDTVLIGNVGLLESHKGQIYSIKAAKILIKEYPRLKVFFVGEGSERTKLQDIVNKNGLGDYIKFIGYRTDIAEIMAAFDIIILTSIREGLPQVLVQAAALGKPIVTFDVEGAKEIVKNGENGFIVPIKDVSQLVEKIRYLLTDLERAKSMGIKGRKLVNDSWNIETMVKKTSNLYQSLAKERGII